MRILVTGATGFVGTHLVRSLTRGDPSQDRLPQVSSLRILTRPTSDRSALEGLGVEAVEGHLADVDSLRRAAEGMDTIIHLAALTRARSESEFQDVNGGGTRRLFQAVLEQDRPARFLYVSSLSAAGPSDGDQPVGPYDTPRPLTAYGRSKLAGEEAVLQASASGEGGLVDVAVLRPPAVYGPGDRDLLPFFRLAARGILPLPSGPVRRVQLIHVQDLVRGILRAVDAEEVVGVYHLAEPQAYTWREVLRFMADAMGVEGRVLTAPSSLVLGLGALSGILGKALGRPQVFDADKARELLSPGWLCETDRAREDLGFQARVSLPEGLERTGQWYREAGWV